MVTLRNVYFGGRVGAAGRQQRSFAGMSVSSMLCNAWSMVVSLGRSSPGASDAAGHCEKGVREQGGLIPWHSVVLSVYLAAVGQNALSESCGCFGKAGQATFIWV